MSPIGHLITSSAMAVYYLHKKGLNANEVIKALSNYLINPNHNIFNNNESVILVAVGIFLGARGPDRLEISSFNRYTRRRTSLIPHRTLTHWPPFWLILTWLALRGYYYPQNYLSAAGWSILLGFCAGSWLHLAMDIMTPMGIPLWLPFGKRTSLNLYHTSSLGEVVCIGFFLTILAVL